MTNRNAALAICFLVSACASVPNEPVHVAYGRVLSVQHRQITEAQANPAGALLGGLAGGTLGHQFGQGNGKTALTVLGAVAGAAAGSQYHQKDQIRQVSDLAVQMPNGEVLNLTAADVGFRPGQKVKVLQQGRQASIEAATEP